MKTLKEIEKNINILKEKIMCQEIGNDSYYLSPLYHEQLLKLSALEHEAEVLKGKSPPIQINFSDCSETKKKILKEIISEEGICFANNYKDLSDTDLVFLNNLRKKSKKI